MNIDQNRDKANDEPAEDGLSALKRLAALDSAGGRVSQADASAPGADAAGRIPDWLELLLAKYGEQATMLVGTGSFLSGPPAGSGTSERGTSEIATLLEQMAVEAEVKPPSEKLATSVDWGKPAQLEEAAEEPAPDRLSQIAKPSTPPSAAPGVEEAPDWLSDLSKLRPEAATQGREEGAEHPASTEDVPDWLRELGAVGLPSEARRVEERPPADEAEVPDWLRDLGMAAPPAKEVSPAAQVEEPSPGPIEIESAESEVPDWLARLTEETQVEAESAMPPHLEKPAPTEEARLVEPGVSELEIKLPGETDLPPAKDQAGEAPAPKVEEETPDWLREMEADFVFPEPSALEVGAEAPVEPEAQAPDWLRELGDLEETPGAPPEPQVPLPPPPTEIAVEAPAEPQAETSDWLLGLGALGETPAAPPPLEPLPSPPLELAAEVPAEPEEELPDWLRELEAHKEAPGVEPSLKLAPEAPAEPEAEIPDWLASLRGEGPSPLEVIPEEAQVEEYAWQEAAEEPSWLAELRTTSQPDVLGLGEEVVEAGEEALPDWLAELRTSQAAPEIPPAGFEVPEETREEVEVEEAIPAEYPLPELEAEPPRAEAVEATSIEGEYPPSETGGALDWLAEIEAAAFLEHPEGEQPSAEAEALPAGEAIPASDRATIETTRLPEWLVGLGEQKGQVPPPEEEARPIEEALPLGEPIAAAEVPDWLLKLKPGEGEPAEAGREALVEAEDVLAGIPGVLPIVEEELEAREEPIAALRSSLGVPTVPDVEGAKLFREIAIERPAEAVQEVKAGAEPESRRGRLVGTLVWALIFLLLIVLIALTLLAVLNRVGDLLGGPAFGEFFGSPLVIDPAPVNTFRAQVTKLPPNAVVVVAFDYSPATEAEMGPLAQIIVRDLLENQARVITVSLRPEGAAMAQRLLKDLEDKYPYGQRTINLGYLPGQTAGVRSLAFLSSAPLFQNGRQTLQDYPAWQDVRGLGDVALIVTVADSPLAMRWWVEQMGPGTLANRPMVAAVSIAADPTVRPYFNQIDPKSGQLLGLLSGTRDAAAYENRLGQPGRAVQSLAAQSVAHLGLVALSLGGTVVGFRTQAAKVGSKG